MLINGDKAFHLMATHSAQLGRNHENGWCRSATEMEGNLQRLSIVSVPWALKEEVRRDSQEADIRYGFKDARKSLHKDSGYTASTSSH